MTDRREQLRETYRKQLRDSIGGWSGTVVAAIPPVVFVAVNAIAGLRWAIGAAIGSALLLAAFRLLRRQPVQQAVGGLFAVVIAALIAARTGQAKGYFLFGIWTSLAYGAALLLTVIVRRPLVGLVWEFLDPVGAERAESPGTAGPAESSTTRGSAGRAAAEQPNLPAWYRQPVLLRAYTVATLGGVAVFAARGVVQLALFAHNATGWLAFARIAMGYPLYIAAVGFGFWIVTRARRRVLADDAALGGSIVDDSAVGDSAVGDSAVGDSAVGDSVAED